jgi:hypothetical protein
MGRHKHPDCGFSWYISPGAYPTEQLKGVFRSGMDAGASAKSEADKEKDKAGGCLGAIFSFLVVAIFSLTQNKPQRSASANQ